MTGPLGEPPRPVADFWHDGQPMPQRLTMPDWDDPEVTALLEEFLAGRPLPARAGTTIYETTSPIASSYLRELFESFDAGPAPSFTAAPMRWDDLVDLYGQFEVPPLPRVVVVDPRSWNALRRVVPVVPAGRPFDGALGNVLGIPVVVRREPRRARPVRRTGPLVLVGRRARHAGMLRVARLQRRVDRRAARRARRRPATSPTVTIITV